MRDNDFQPINFHNCSSRESDSWKGMKQISFEMPYSGDSPIYGRTFIQINATFFLCLAITSFFFSLTGSEYVYEINNHLSCDATAVKRKKHSVFK